MKNRINLSVFLAIGESWEDFEAKGQASLLLNNNYLFYSQEFARTDVFSYGKYSGKLRKNIILHGNSHRIHRYIYAFLVPLVYYKHVRKAQILRGMQLSSVIPLLVAKILFRKNVVLNYGYDYTHTALQEKKYLQIIWYKVLETFFLKYVDAVIVTTAALGEKVRQFGAQKIALVPNSVNTNVFKKIERIPKNISVLFVGRLEEQKNLLSLLNAISKITQKEKLKVMFIGNGSQKEVLKAYALTHGIHLQIIDTVPNHELPRYYNSSKIFVLNSYIEGHPKALLEAMSCQLPVIGADVPGINNLIIDGKNGLLVRKQEELSAAIRLLLSNKMLCTTLGRGARKTIEQNFQQKGNWKKEITLLKSLAK